MSARVGASAEQQLPWLVCEDAGLVVGYAYATTWKSRCAYRYSAETSVYLSQQCVRKGIGSKLMQELIVRLRALVLHSILAGIALPNEASIALHEKLGFEKVAHFKEVGRKFDRWIDVAYWELILEN